MSKQMTMLTVKDNDEAMGVASHLLEVTNELEQIVDALIAGGGADKNRYIFMPKIWAITMVANMISRQSFIDVTLRNLITEQIRPLGSICLYLKTKMFGLSDRQYLKKAKEVKKIIPVFRKVIEIVTH